MSTPATTPAACSPVLLADEPDLPAPAPSWLPDPIRLHDDLNVIQRQPTINIGTLGHVAHGKSTLVRQLTGVRTQRFAKEDERNITIKLGYANAKIWRCPVCPGAAAYRASGSDLTALACARCQGEMALVRHVSFVDCPGHDALMATALAGAAVMDHALLVVAADQPCPQPQTAEHLVAAETAGLAGLTVVQTKVDLCARDRAAAHRAQIAALTAGTLAQDAPVVPTCGHLPHNLDVLCRRLVCMAPPPRDLAAPPELVVVRSFDVNRPGELPDSLRGGVAGGSLLRGVLRLGQQVELRPGLVRRTASGALACAPLRSRVVSLASEAHPLAIAVPGGLIGVGLSLDPALAKQDRLVGQRLGLPGALPPVYLELSVSYDLLKRVVGLGEAGAGGTPVAELRPGDALQLHIAASTVAGRVLAAEKAPGGSKGRRGRQARVQLEAPVCVALGTRAALSQHVAAPHQPPRWRLVGAGTLTAGVALPLAAASATTTGAP